MGLLNPGGPIAQFKRNRCSISPVEVILLCGVRSCTIQRNLESPLFQAFFSTYVPEKAFSVCIKDSVFIDPCCGSGGMFIQSAALVKAKQGDISRINIYAQEKDSATYRLAKMNLALRGISHNLGATYDSSFTNDQHKGLYFNYSNSQKSSQ